MVYQSGKQCLCRYTLPSAFGEDHILHDLKSSQTSSTTDMKIIGLADAVHGRANIVVNKGQVKLCIYFSLFEFEGLISFSFQWFKQYIRI